MQLVLMLKAHLLDAPSVNHVCHFGNGHRRFCNVRGYHYLADTRPQSEHLRVESHFGPEGAIGKSSTMGVLAPKGPLGEVPMRKRYDDTPTHPASLPALLKVCQQILPRLATQAM
jgi:hypothetical protein